MEVYFVWSPVHVWCIHQYIDGQSKTNLFFYMLLPPKLSQVQTCTLEVTPAPGVLQEKPADSVVKLMSCNLGREVDILDIWGICMGDNCLRQSRGYRIQLQEYKNKKMKKNPEMPWDQN